MIKAIDLANYFVERGLREKNPVSNMKLQKLLFYCQGWHLGATDVPLFGEEIQKWTWGPVCPVVYRKFRKYGAGAITVPDENGDSKLAEPESLGDAIWSIYGQHSALELSELSHKEQPWIETEMFQPITVESMRNWFKKLLQRGSESVNAAEAAAV